MYTCRHCASIAYDFNLNLHPVCAANVLLINEHILDNFFKQLCLRVIIMTSYYGQNVGSVYETCQHPRFALSNGK